MKFFTAYKPFYKNNLRLALPVILSQMGQITVQLADTAMVGRYGGRRPHAAGRRSVRHEHILHSIHRGDGPLVRTHALGGRVLRP